MSLPLASPVQAFEARRGRLRARLATPALLPAGTSRPRNFPHNRYPFRAESHFLYFVGRALEGAALYVDSSRAVLYVPLPDPEAALWTGPQPSLDELAVELRIEVRPLGELAPAPDTATPPPQDWETALWLEQLLGRSIEPGTGADGESFAVSQSAWAAATVPCPHSASSAVGENQRSANVFGAPSTKTVAGRLSSAASACMNAAERGRSSRQTAAGLPRNGASAKASTCSMGVGMALGYRHARCRADPMAL